MNQPKKMTVAEAKALWRKAYPYQATHLTSHPRDLQEFARRENARASLDGFVTALKMTGHVEVH